MRAPIKDHIREALLTAALFGSLGAAVAQAPATKPGNIGSAESPKVPGHEGVEEPTVKQAPAPAAEAGVFVNGTLNVPNAPKDTSTTPAKFSQGNDRLDHVPIMARGPQLDETQRKLIIDRVLGSSTGAQAQISAGPATELPASVDMQAWPDDVVGQVPSLRDTKYVKLADKVLVVRPESRTVVEEISR
jgi:hypothetical protein